MREEDEVVISPLSCTIDRNGKHVQINIYRGTLAGDDWICELIEGDEPPTVSNDMYVGDQAALEAAIESLSSARTLEKAKT